jgi:hypothetical protein
VTSPGSGFGEYSQADANETAVRIAPGELGPFTCLQPGGPQQLWKLQFVQADVAPLLGGARLEGGARAGEVLAFGQEGLAVIVQQTFEVGGCRWHAGRKSGIGRQCMPNFAGSIWLFPGRRCAILAAADGIAP